MCKDTKRTYDPKRVAVVKLLAERYSVTPDTVRKAIRGDLKSEKGEIIKRAFVKKYKELESILKYHRQ